VSPEQHYQTVEVSAGPLTELSAPEVLPFVGDWAGELTRLWSLDPPDVVHAHGWLGGLAAQLAARRHGLPTVQTFHGLAATSDAAGGLPTKAERARLEPLLARNAAWVTGGSSAEVNVLAGLRRSRARISVLSTGVDSQRFAPVGPALDRPDRYRILCLERNPLSCNGFDTMIRLLPKLTCAELVIAETAPSDRGHDEERAGLKNLAATMEVSERVRFMGYVAAKELPKLLRSVDVVACTPRYSPYATTALQAMASGVAVVAVATGAVTDTVVHSITGLLTGPDNPQELVAALKALQTQPFQRLAMGAAGRNRARSRFTWERIAYEALNIYQRLSPQQTCAGARR
jgi:glycosyltransferase involved in cell wall biosynthesis